MLNEARDGSPRIGAAVEPARHAIVIGSSLAGLLAGRVLCDHFDRVTILDRDQLPSDPSARPGVPQARHAHVLLLRGQQILEHLFPGFQADLADAGAPAVDWMAEWLVFQRGWLPRRRSPFVTRACSRDLLEWNIRRRLAASGKVDWLEQRAVIGLVADASGARAIGVRLRPRGASSDGLGGEQTLLGALVVDASGRDSQAPGWLAALGYDRPAETTINSLLGYASRWYARPPETQGQWLGVTLGADPPHLSRAGVIDPVEGSRWIVTLAGIGGDYPPTDGAGFLTFARGLAHPVLYDAIKNAQPLSQVFGYRRTENRLRHYERLTRWPACFVVLGDAVAAFNPVYGQGMTVSAQGAMLLDRCLREHKRRFPGDNVSLLGSHFQQQLARLIATPWSMATGEDLRWPKTVGGKLRPIERLVQQYLDCVGQLAHADVAVFRNLLLVYHLMQPPTTLFHPQLVLRVAQLLARQKLMAAKRRQTQQMSAAGPLPAVLGE